MEKHQESSLNAKEASSSLQVKEGDEVAPGDVLCEVETDKATMAWENQDEGFVARILLPDGAQNVPIGTPALLLVDDAADIAAFKDFKPAGARNESSLSLSKASEELSETESGENFHQCRGEVWGRRAHLGLQQPHEMLWST